MNKLLMRTVSALNTCIYQVSGGRWLGRFPSGAPVCLLTTQGRKSGQRRTVPLLYLADGDDLVLVASQGGAPQHPGWYFNLVANPTAEVQVGRRRFQVAARTVSADETAALWPRLVAIYPPYEAYQQRTTRSIPVVRLSPATGAGILRTST
jgi:deazaflavin-dependent oxidoreductase (nitroreductase family)